MKNDGFLFENLPLRENLQFPINVYKKQVYGAIWMKCEELLEWSVFCRREKFQVATWAGLEVTNFLEKRLVWD